MNPVTCSAQSLLDYAEGALPSTACLGARHMDEFDEAVARDISRLVVEYNMQQAEYPSDIAKRLAKKVLSRLKKRGISHELNVKLLVDKYLAQGCRDAFTGELLLPGEVELRPLLSASGYTYRNTIWVNSSSRPDAEWILDQVHKGAV